LKTLPLHTHFSAIVNAAIVNRLHQLFGRAPIVFPAFVLLGFSTSTMEATPAGEMTHTSAGEKPVARTSEPTYQISAVAPVVRAPPQRMPKQG
jgi:hypothetical protein